MKQIRGHGPTEVAFLELITLEELQEIRRYSLLKLMQEISDACWGTLWNKGLERHLWRMAFEDASPEYGMGSVEIHQLTMLQHYSQMTDTWWVAGETSRMWLKISLQDAHERYSEAARSDR